MAHLLQKPVLIIKSEKSQERQNKVIVWIVKKDFIVFKVIQALMNVLKDTIVTVKITQEAL